MPSSLATAASSTSLSASTPTASTSMSTRTMAPSDGSRTLVVANPEHDKGEGRRDESPPPIGALRLRGGPRSRPRVAWDADVVDNEHMGKKKSKICCIYHKPKAFDESSDESSSDSDSDNDSAPSDDGSARPSQRSRRHRHCSHGSHDHDHAASSHGALHSADSVDTTVEHYHHPDKPNAYEFQPPIKGKGRANGN